MLPRRLVVRGVVSISDAQKAAALVGQAVASTRSEIATHFGCGEPAAEAACDRVHVFLRRTSHTSEEKWRALLPPTATLLDARAALERMSGREAGELEGHDVQDENGYVIDGALHGEPLSRFSCGCCVNLDFVHTPVSDAVSGMATAAGRAAGAVAGAAASSASERVLGAAQSVRDKISGR